jgi:hypothetical protein
MTMTRIEVLSLTASWDHALKHLIGDRRNDSVDEGRAHLWIAAQMLYGLLFTRSMRLAPFLPQLLARRILVFLDDLVGAPIHEWVLPCTGHGFKADQYRHECEQANPG